MSKRAKLLERIRQNSKNVRFDEIETILTGLGFAMRVKGSHHTFTYQQWRITIPYRTPFVLPVYVKELLALLEAIEHPAASVEE